MASKVVWAAKGMGSKAEIDLLQDQSQKWGIGERKELPVSGCQSLDQS